MSVRAVVRLSSGSRRELERPLREHPREMALVVRCGVEVVSLIPTRSGNGALDRLMESGEFSQPSLATLERSFEQSLALNTGRVFVGHNGAQSYYGARAFRGSLRV